MAEGKAGNLYFIALVPPDPVFEEALAIRKYFAASYNSKAALKSPPHITLHMPFRMKDKKVSTLVAGLTEAAGKVPPFTVQLNGFGAFPPRVIYIHVENTDQLKDLYHTVREVIRKELHIDNADWKNRGYTPHLTVAFRDLRKSMFHEAWNEFADKPFCAAWEAKSLCLLRHTGEKWVIHHEVNLSESK